MRMNEVRYTDAKPIDGYGPGFFRVGGDVFNSGVLVLPMKTMSWGGYDDLAPILDLAGEIDVLFVGTGAEIAHVPAEFRTALDEVAIGVEAMGSPSAARTYNVLLSEGRRIGAALLPV